MSRSLLLSIISGLVAGAFLFAYHKAHQPMLDDDQQTEGTVTQCMNAALVVDYGGRKVSV